MDFVKKHNYIYVVIKLPNFDYYYLEKDLNTIYVKSFRIIVAVCLRVFNNRSEILNMNVKTEQKTNTHNEQQLCRPIVL